ncbi:MAG TPA: glycosyltransferase family 25 protein [Aquamicrobium sp.]|nr:glycosyltransferase family 25 protein [Aquamicrobium sp.]
MRIEGFVIHLARAERRRPQVEALRGALPMPVHVIEEIASVYRPRLYRPRYPFALGAGEIGCFLSHRKAWREIVARDLDAGLIVEDDVAVDAERLRRLLDLVGQVAGPADFVRFPQKERGEAGPVVGRGESGSLLIEPVTPAFGTVMQIVGRDAAARLLDLTETFDRPVDVLLQMRWLHRIRILSARPLVTAEISRELGGTLVQARRHSLSATMKREIQRPLYRGTVRLLNRLTRLS